MARRRSSRGAGEGLSSLARRPVEGSELREAVANLAMLDLAGLRLQWRNVFGGAAPLHLPKSLLARILAYRLQADALGDLSNTLRRTLEGFGARSSDLGGQAGGDGSILSAASCCRANPNASHRRKSDLDVTDGLCHRTAA